MLACIQPVATGAQGDGFVQVSAAVLPRTQVLVEPPPVLNISAEDRARGSAMAAMPLTVRAWSNTRHGLELDIQAPAGMFASMRVQGHGIDATLPGDGGTIAWRWSAKPGFATPASLDLQFTFALNGETRVGTYSWPVIVSGTALPN